MAGSQCRDAFDPKPVKKRQRDAPDLLVIGGRSISIAAAHWHDGQITFILFDHEKSVGSMKPTSIYKSLFLFMALLWTESAKAHGIAGNRYFDGTMTFDDPAVADEAIVPNFSYPAILPRAATCLRTVSAGRLRGS